MIEIFDRDSGLRFGGKSTMALDFILAKHIRTVKISTEYYAMNYKFVPNDHLLVRLINWFPWNITSGKFTSYTSAVERSRDIALLFGITTYESKGDIHKGDFNFKKGYVVMSNGELDIREINKPWKSLRPFKLMVREGVSHGLELPTGDSSLIPGYGVFHIDIPQLAVMVSGWHEHNAKLPVNKQDTIQEFVGKYILPSLILDTNRCIYLTMLGEWDKSPMDRYKASKVPFQYMDQNNALYNQIVPMMEEANKEEIHHRQALAEYRGYDLDSMEELMPAYVSTIVTENNFWIYLLSNFKFTMAILRISENDGDMDLSHRMKVLNRRVKGQNTFNKTPSPLLGKEMEKRYKDIGDLIEEKVK